MLIREWSNDPPEVIGLDPYIAVIHEEMLVASGLRHVLEIAHLHVRPKHIRADEQTDCAVGELPLQLFDAGYGGIGQIADAENDLVLGIALQTMAAEALIDFRVGALQRFKNLDGGQIRWMGSLAGRPAPTTKRGCAPQADQVIKRAGNTAENRDDLEDPGDKVHHA